MTTPEETQPPAKTAWTLDPVHSSIGFAVKHMAISTIKGRFGRFEANIDFDPKHPERSSGEVKMAVASIDTRDEGRDGHLRSPDFLDAEKHPWIYFKSRRIEPRAGDHYDVVGDLTIRGVPREVVLDAEYSGLAKDPWGNQRVGFAATTTISRKDFGLTWNVALETGGWVVGDAVKLDIDAELMKPVGP